MSIATIVGTIAGFTVGFSRFIGWHTRRIARNFFWNTVCVILEITLGLLLVAKEIKETWRW